MAREISLKKRLIVFDKSKGKCNYCGCKIYMKSFHVDHIIPRNRNLPPHERGTNDIENLTAACMSCNASKSNSTIDVWRKKIELKYDKLLESSSQFRLLVRLGIIKKTSTVKFYFEKQKS